MERLTRFMKRQKPARAEYEPIHHDDDFDAEDLSQEERQAKVPFSWVEYLIFLLLGVAQLWAW